MGSRDEVFGSALVFNGGSGSFAQMCTANVANTARKPKNISHSEAASLPLVGASAVQALEQHIGLKKQQKVKNVNSIVKVNAISLFVFNLFLLIIFFILLII